MNTTRSSFLPIYSKSNFAHFWASRARILLFTFLAIDFIFMGLHAMGSLGYLSDPNFSVTKNFGYAETFQYLKAGFLAICFLILAIKYGRPLFYCWTAAFTFILLDDSIEIHEYLGYHLGEFLENNNLGFNLGNSAGELIVFGIFGLLIFVPLFYYFYKSKDREVKIVTQDMFILFAGLIFFGVGIDLVHDFTATGTVLNGVLGLAEDGGEMLIMSVMVWYLWAYTEEGKMLRKEKLHYSNRTNKSSTKPGYHNPMYKDRAAYSNSQGDKNKSTQKDKLKRS